MVKHILVPLDGSELAAKAVSYAKTLLDSGGTLTLFTACEPIEASVVAMSGEAALMTNYGNLQSDLQDVATAYLKDYAETMQNEDFHVKKVVIVGDPATQIKEYSKKEGVEIIVMTTHGRTGLERFLLGSVTNKVLNHAPCPVLVIPGEQHSE